MVLIISLIDFFVNNWYIIPVINFWADSSAGRAPRLQRGGLGFESLSVHLWIFAWVAQW